MQLARHIAPSVVFPIGHLATASVQKEGELQVREGGGDEMREEE